MRPQFCRYLRYSRLSDLQVCRYLRYSRHLGLQLCRYLRQVRQSRASVGCGSRWGDPIGNNPIARRPEETRKMQFLDPPGKSQKIQPAGNQPATSQQPASNQPAASSQPAASRCPDLETQNNSCSPPSWDGFCRYSQYSRHLRLQFSRYLRYSRHWRLQVCRCLRYSRDLRLQFCSFLRSFSPLEQELFAPLLGRILELGKILQRDLKS